MTPILLAACSAIAVLAAGAAAADPQTDEANRQRQMASMRAEAARNDQLSADRSLARQQATADAARASAGAGASPASGNGSPSSYAGPTAAGGSPDSGPQSVVDSYTIVIRTEETPQQMLARLAQAAADGDTGAQYNLGRIYYTGFNDAPRDDVRARGYFREAAEAGHAASQANYGYFLMNGVGGPPDAAEGRRWVQAAAEAGNSFGQTLYGMSLVSGDAARAAQYLIPAADAGEVAAQGMMGTLYAMGEGVAQDDARAVHYLRSASDQGEVGSTGLLAGMYLSHRGGTEAEGYALLRQAAEREDADSQRNYGLLLVQGHGVPKDELAGASMVRRAAEAGNRSAQNLMGHLYNEGLGVPQADADAIHWWTLAAAAGDEESIGILAELRGGSGAPARTPAQGEGAAADVSATPGPVRTAPIEATAPSRGPLLQGELSGSDAKLADDSFYDCQVVQTSVRTVYRASMRSDAFDTYLSVGTGECSGTAALSDDDGGGGTNSAVSFSGDGRPWFVRANSLSAGATGAYTLEIAEVAQSPTITPGEPARGDLSASDLKLADGSFYDCHPVQTRPGASYRVAMLSSDFDTYLSVGKGQCAGTAEVNDDDGGGGTNSLLSFTGDGQLWFVRANSLEANATGAYSVELTEGGDPAR